MLVLLSFYLFPTPYPHRGRGAWKNIKRCAVDKAILLILKGIDPSFTHLEGGNPLLDTGRLEGSTRVRNCLGAALIRRKLCEGDSLGLLIHPDDQFLTRSFGVVPVFLLASWGERGAAKQRSEGSRSGHSNHYQNAFCPFPLRGRLGLVQLEERG